MNEHPFVEFGCSANSVVQMQVLWKYMHFHGRCVISMKLCGSREISMQFHTFRRSLFLQRQRKRTLFFGMVFRITVSHIKSHGVLMPLLVNGWALSLRL